MRSENRTSGRVALLFAVPVLLGVGLLWGCGAAGTAAFEMFGTPFTTLTGEEGISGPTTTERNTGSAFGGNNREAVDPCLESQPRKFVTITMRNETDDYIHYFLVLVALVNSETYPEGAVCPEDVSLYTSFGYQEIPEGVDRPFGDYCFEGPALVYFHQSGQFRGSAGQGGTSLASAIAPAQGASPTYDGFFTSTGAQVPVPDRIYFHNPGTGEGAALKVSFAVQSPCSEDALDLGDGPCFRDAFYYVDETDRMTGSTALGVGSGRRVPTEIQGTGCECTGFSDAFQQLAPSGVSANFANCNEYLRGGRIEYVFVREDTNPPFPQLVWRVTDQTGSVAHDFDDQAGLN